MNESFLSLHLQLIVSFSKNKLINRKTTNFFWQFCSNYVIDLKHSTKQR
jgi:hypothetical protein